MTTVEPEQFIREQIANEDGHLSTRKEVYDGHVWTWVDVTYELCGSVTSDSGRMKVLVALRGCEPLPPTVNVSDLVPLIEEDLRFRFHDDMQEADFKVEVDRQSIEETRRLGMVSFLRREFLELCRMREMPLEDALEAALRFLEAEVGRSHFFDMEHFICLKRSQNLADPYRLDRMADEAEASADEFLRDEPQEHPLPELMETLEQADSHIQKGNFGAAEDAMRKAKELMKRLKEIRDGFQGDIYLQDYKLEMAKGNNELGIKLLKRYMNYCRDLFAGSCMALTYSDAAEDAEKMGDLTLAKQYLELYQLAEKARGKVEFDYSAPSDGEW